ncbi:DUF6597 domain-containing transcriptional factor [Streptomyces sp. NPDC002476]|uniref:DUF6597 domain-containing transcriptional factor n=1 Tax=Streptomyces sp. NPDC002476 TaxID=3364648 RepID=UPI0036B37440
MAGPRRDTRGIVDATGLFTRVRFRRREPAPALRPYLEHYWLVDWDLAKPYASHLVPHPSVNVVFQRHAAPPAHGNGYAEVSGIAPGLFVQKLEGRGRVCGVQFRPGGFRPFAPDRPVSDWTGRRLPVDEVFVPPVAPSAVLDPADEDARVAALDAYLLALGPEPDPRRPVRCIARRRAALVPGVRGRSRQRGEAPPHSLAQAHAPPTRRPAARRLLFLLRPQPASTALSKWNATMSSRSRR